MFDTDNQFEFYGPVTFNFGPPCVPTKPKQIRFACLGFEIASKPQTKESPMLNVSLRTNQYARINLAPLDADNKPVVVENLAVKVTSGDAVASIVDGKVQIVPSDVPGESTFEVSADGQPGEAVEVLTETITLTSIAPNAISLGATVEVRQKSELTTPPAGEGGTAPE